ncbi:MAG: hypothetical protein ACOH1M_01975 [Rhodoglobus sp.]
MNRSDGEVAAHAASILEQLCSEGDPGIRGDLARRYGIPAQDAVAWCADFDNWALVDTACFVLFDKAPDAWTMLEPWASSTTEFTTALGLVERNASDPRHLVGKA